MKTVFRVLSIAILCTMLFGGLWTTTPRTEAQSGTWTVFVYNNKDLAGSPAYTSTVTGISYTWGAGAPVINGIDTSAFGVPVDRFSVKFQTSAFFTAGNYRFTVQVDDGARLYIDGLLLINNWSAGGFRTLQADYNFTSDGNHNIEVQMFDEVDNAQIVASWALAVGPIPTMCTEGYTYSACPQGSSPGGSPAPAGWPPTSGPTAICNDGWNSCSTNASGTCSSHSGVRTWCLSTPTTGVPWYAEFFNGIDLVAPAIYTASFPPTGLSQNWLQGSPGGAVPVDNFSARFTRSLNVPTDLPQGIYTFYARADDNYRFWVDSTLIIDKWDTWGGDVTTAEVTLLNGPHTLKFEYRERTVDANIFLTWTPPNAQNPVLPPEGGGAGGGGQPTGITATVNTSVLNFRSAPSPTAEILAKLNRGDQYPVTGRSADSAWAQLSVNGVTGWASAQYLTFSGDFASVPVVDGGGGGPGEQPMPPPAVGIRGMVLGNLRLREGPSTRYRRIGLMPWGTMVDVLGKDQGHAWYKVNFDGLIGWAYAPWIKLVEGSFDALPYLDGAQPVYAPPAPTQGVIVQAYGNMRIRNGPGFQYPKIGKAVWGTRVQVLGKSSDGLWYKIQHGDLVGWSYATWYRAVQGDIGAVPVVTQ